MFASTINLFDIAFEVTIKENNCNFISKLKVLKIKRQTNIANASYLFTQTSYLVKTYTTTAREPSIYHTARWPRLGG